jgi:hypothetical protein
LNSKINRQILQANTRYLNQKRQNDEVPLGYVGGADLWATKSEIPLMK